MSIFRKKSIDSILKQVDSEIGVGMKKSLNVKDLTAFGIAAIIGAGIFSTIGNAAYNGGPAISLLFLFTAVACGFSALCYAQFASTIPISGSAYTYAYSSFGEIIAWIIGWDLIMEYAVGNIAVAISWSDYFTSFLLGVGVNFPEFLSIDYLSASRGFAAANQLLTSGTAFADLSVGLQSAFTAWTNAPELFGIKLIADIPAFSIVTLITILVYVGIRETKIAGNIMVILKVAILLIIIAIGAFYVKIENWSPFAPNGIGGVLKGVSGVFFAYIGFDAISTTAEECKNPKRDLPRSMIFALIITTILYILISLVITGMVSYKELGVGDPLAYVFQKLSLTRLSGVIAVSAIIAMASVLLVFQVGQPRIWMSMSRDGLLPKRFSKLHPKFQTPAFATVLTGILVAIPSLFLNLTEVTDLTSIGTLFAFALVSGGVLVMDITKDTNFKNAKFKIPYINSRIFLPIIWIIIFGIIFYLNRNNLDNLFNFQTNNESIFEIWQHKILDILYFIFAIGLTIFAVYKKLSIIPVLGLLTNLYLMSQLGITNWLRFIIWLAIGLILYFGYGRKHSKLANLNNEN